MNIPKLPVPSMQHGLKHAIILVEAMPPETMFNMAHYSEDVIGKTMFNEGIWCEHIQEFMSNIFGLSVGPKFMLDQYCLNNFTYVENEVLKLFTQFHGDYLTKSEWLKNANEVYYKFFVENVVFDFTKRTGYHELPEMIVSAAQKSPDGLVIMSRRHFDSSFYAVADKIFEEGTKFHDWDEGFYTNKNRYVDRYEAWEIAKAAFQIKRITGYPGKLYSEDIY